MPRNANSPIILPKAENDNQDDVLWIDIEDIYSDEMDYVDDDYDILEDIGSELEIMHYTVH